jgi:hypothetical protein
MFATPQFERLASLLLSGLIVGCATSSDKVSSSYVSPLQYASFTCDQIKPELLRVNSQIVKVAGVQDEVATKDSVAMGVGLVLFWPALFFLASGDDKQAELANLKGQYEALESTAIQKNCDIAPELIAAKAQREELKKQQEAKQREAAITP